MALENVLAYHDRTPSNTMTCAQLYAFARGNLWRSSVFTPAVESCSHRYVHGAAPTPRSHQPASRPSYACPRARRLHSVTDFIQLTPHDTIIDLMGLGVTRKRRRK